MGESIDTCPSSSQEYNDFPYSNSEIDAAMEGIDVQEDKAISEGSSFADEYEELVLDETTMRIMDGLPSEPPPTEVATASSASSRNTSNASIKLTTSLLPNLPTVPPTLLGKRGRTGSLPTELSVKKARTQNENPFLDNYSILSDSKKPHVIVHFLHLQDAFNVRDIRFGTRWEIARWLTRFNPNDIPYGSIKIPKLNYLIGSTEQSAPAVKYVLGDQGDQERTPNKFESDYAKRFRKESVATSPWAELDREHERLTKNKYAGLGIEDDEWFAGKVNFRLSIKKNKLGTMCLALEKPELGSSDRFSRRFGSAHFLRLKITKEFQSAKNLVNFLKRPVVVWDHVYRAFLASDGNTFFVQTNEIWDAESKTFTEGSEMSWLAFLEWHNSLQLNNSQTMAKWASRFNLGRSTSVPGITLDEVNIRYINDIVSTSGSDMTDGAGLINDTALRLVMKKYVLDHYPSCIQVRIVGAKGLLVRYPFENSDVPIVWLRPSMIKIRHITPLSDIALRMIDILRFSHASIPGKLNYQVIINLWENGVSSFPFTRLLEQDLRELIRPFMEWEGIEPAFDMWLAAARLGSVVATRRAREESWLARLNGGYDTEKNKDELEENEDGFDELDMEKEQSTAWWGDEESGQPSSLEETVMYALESGFVPQTCPPLRAKISNMLKFALRRHERNMHISLPMSATAFLVPDAFEGRSSILKPGEIYFRSSRMNILTPEGKETDLVLGDVLITRNPCRLPTDVQKWTAVDCPTLRDITDVIVLSVQGDRRTADFLAGGDYDGDKGLLIWQPDLVEPFKNADLKYATEPEGLKEKNFCTKNTTVMEFLAQHQMSSKEDTISALQDILLSSLKDIDVVGQYSSWHEISAYLKSYDHPDSIRLAYMFTLILDGAKTGLTVDPKVFRADRFVNSFGSMAWREQMTSGNKSSKSALHVSRPPEMRKYVMDILMECGKDIGENLIGDLEKKFGTGNTEIPRALEFKPDMSLRVPYDEAVTRAEYFKQQKISVFSDELEQIKAHVLTIYRRHREHIQHRDVLSSPQKNMSPSKRSSFTERSIESRQDVLRKFSKDFWQFYHSHVEHPSSVYGREELAAIMASCAYVIDITETTTLKHWTPFAWNVALGGLCDIKARYAGGEGRHKTITGSFYNRMQVKKRK